MDLDRFENLGIVKSNLNFDDSKLNLFIDNITAYKKDLVWDKDKLLNEFVKIIPDFDHKETGKSLDSKM